MGLPMRGLEAGKRAALVGSAARPAFVAIFGILAVVVVVGGYVWVRLRSLKRRTLPLRPRAGSQDLRAGDCGLHKLSEATRDFSRTFAAAGILVTGLGQGKAALVSSAKASDGTSQDHVEEMVAEFTAALEGRLQRSPLARSVLAKVGAAEVCRRLLGHLAVTPALQLSIQLKLPMALHQPKYVVILGQTQVRVATYTFIGGPVSGDRPDRKHTPFVLKMLSPNLLACDCPLEADATVTLQYACRATNHQSTTAVIEEDAPVLALAVASGEWETYARV